MSGRTWLLGAALASLLYLCLPQRGSACPAADQAPEGPQRVVRMDGKVYEGTVEIEGDSYKIHPTKYPNMTIVLKKREILRMEPLPAERATPAPAASITVGGKGADGPLLTDEEIAHLLRGIEVDTAFLDDIADPTVSLPVNEESVAEMMVIAGKGAEAKRLETDHFVFVYTSELSLARKLAARLESVYRWNVRLLELLNLPYEQPEYKLEIYFFGKHDEYARFQNVLGMPDRDGVLGFYRPDLNQSAFFDMQTWPPIQGRVEASERPEVPYRQRQLIRNENERWIEWKNIEVVQHEAAHHIHFNIGVFSREAFVSQRLPRWTVEGLATMFELPPTAAGAALGGINHMRVQEFRCFFQNGTNLPDMRDFILDDSIFLRGGGTFYPLGWALSQYMWRKHREPYAKWVRALSELGDHEEFTRTDRQKLYEDIFGEMNEDWVKGFVDYIQSIELKASLLPPDIFER